METLTTTQLSFVNDALDKLQNQTGGVIVLLGSAGTGKSYCLTILLQEALIRGLLKEEEIFSVGPTQKSIHVLKERNIPGKVLTLHKLMYKSKVVSVDHDKFQTNFSEKLIPSSEVKCKVLCVDETSMLAPDEVQYLCELITRKENPCLVIFTGDHNQLPAVKAVYKGSGAYVLQKKSHFNLTEVKRASGSLLDYCSTVREALNNNWTTKDVKDLAIEAANGNTVIYIDSLDEDQLKELADDGYLFICYTNKMRNHINEVINGKNKMPTLTTPIVCESNITPIGVFNGGLMTIQDILTRKNEWNAEHSDKPIEVLFSFQNKNAADVSATAPSEDKHWWLEHQKQIAKAIRDQNKIKESRHNYIKRCIELRITSLCESYEVSRRQDLNPEEMEVFDINLLSDIEDLIQDNYEIRTLQESQFLQDILDIVILKFPLPSIYWLKIDTGSCLTVHKCVTGDTIILTEDGLCEIKDYQQNKKVFDGENFCTPNEFIENGLEDIYRVHLTNGTWLDVSETHDFISIAKNGDFVKIPFEGLEVGTILLRSKQSPIQQKYIELESRPKDLYCNISHYSFPKLLTEDIGLLFGMICADGCIAKNQHGNFARGNYSKRHRECVEEFVDKFYIAFGKRLEIKEKKNFWIAEWGSREIAEWLSKIEGLLPQNKYIPKEILISPPSVQAAFLRGLFEDGEVHLKNGKFDMIEFTFHDERMLNQLNCLLLGFGIEASFRKVKTNYRCYVYRNGAEIFRDKIGFISAFKQNRLIFSSKHSERKGSKILREGVVEWAIKNNVNTKGISNLKHTTGQLTNYNWHNIYKDLSRTLYAKDSLIERINQIYNNFFFSEVTSIEKIAPQKTYCFTMPENHMFIQNGILGGNCQGSQAPNICYILEPNATKNHIYTAITRAEKSLIITDKIEGAH